MQLQLVRRVRFLTMRETLSASYLLREMMGTIEPIPTKEPAN